MRGADAGPLPFLTALSAFWVGLLYDDGALDAAWDMVKGWTAEERQKLRDDAPRLALKARIGGHDLAEIARLILAISRSGLKRRARLDAEARDESRYLDVLDVVASSGRTQAENLLDRFHGPWGGRVEDAFRECVF
jgi:glutamate--cysteine ligase